MEFFGKSATENNFPYYHLKTIKLTSTIFFLKFFETDKYPPDIIFSYILLFFNKWPQSYTGPD